MLNLDEIDLVLINELQENSKQSVKQLASKVNLSVSPVHERIKRIEASGIIRKHVALVDSSLLDKKMTVYCQIKLIKHQQELFKEFEDYIVSFDEVLEVGFIAGQFDFLIKVVLKDMEEFQSFVKNKLSKVKIIANIHSFFIMSHIKNETKIVL